MKLTNRIIEILNVSINKSSDDWSIAAILYPGFPYKDRPGNGAKISNIRRACQKDERIIQFNENCFALRDSYTQGE